MKTMLMIMSAGLVLSGAALAQNSSADAPRRDSPETIEGQVTKVEPDRGRITIRANDGTVHAFEAPAETLRSYKAGEPIKARLRKPAP